MEAIFYVYQRNQKTYCSVCSKFFSKFNTHKKIFSISIDIFNNYTIIILVNSLITGILKQKSGTVKILDQEVSSKNRKIFQQVGCLIEQVSLYPHLTGYEHIQIVAKLTDTKIDEHVETLISTLKMNSYIHNKTKTYSQGMKQRLGILLAVLNKPKLLLLDEPLNGLDPEGVYEIRTFLLNICHQEGMSLLISSHILSEMQIFCDRFLFLKDGVISKDLTKSDLKNSNLEQEFIEDNQE